MKRILFVDDEALILQAIQRSLRSMREEWDMVFATSPAEALEKMGETPFDLIVSDMRMPGFDGVTLLEEVKARYPETARFILSGQCDREALIRSTGPTHQFFSKPCEMAELRTKVTQALAFGDKVHNPSVRRLIAGLHSIPSPPALYLAVMAEIQSHDPSSAKVGKIVSQDPSMTAKILQMVNSSFFGLRCRVSSAQQAVTLLGLDIVSTLVLSAHVFSQFSPSVVSRLGLDRIAQFAILTATLAKKLAIGESAPVNLQDESFTAGILHDIGKLMLATGFPTEYRSCIELMNEQKIPDWQAEQEIFHCAHPEIGAHLLGTWGLPVQIAEAVAWHHRPSESPIKELHPLLPVHVAAVFVENTEAGIGWNESFDRDFLAGLGLGSQEKQDRWADLLWNAVAGLDIGPARQKLEMTGAAR